MITKDVMLANCRKEILAYISDSDFNLLIAEWVWDELASSKEFDAAYNEQVANQLFETCFNELLIKMKNVLRKV